jgi:hypothetical protein
LCSDYEALRGYVLSPVKTLSRPIGLDLWNKKGFLAWTEVVFHAVPEAIPSNRSSSNISGTSPVLVKSLANILFDWSDKNGKYDVKQ